MRVPNPTGSKTVGPTIFIFFCSIMTVFRCETSITIAYPHISMKNLDTLHQKFFLQNYLFLRCVWHLNESSQNENINQNSR